MQRNIWNHWQMCLSEGKTQKGWTEEVNVREWKRLLPSTNAVYIFSSTLWLVVSIKNTSSKRQRFLTHRRKQTNFVVSNSFNSQIIQWSEWYWPSPGYSVFVHEIYSFFYCAVGRWKSRRDLYILHFHKHGSASTHTHKHAYALWVVIKIFSIIFRNKRFLLKIFPLTIILLLMLFLNVISYFLFLI